MGIPNEYESELPKMDWKPIDRSEFNEVLDLLDISFPISREIIERDLNEIMKNPRAEGKVHRLKANGKIIGTATYGRVYGNQYEKSDDPIWRGEGFMRYWAIHPKYRGKKYGIWILSKVMIDLQNAGSPCLALSVLASDTTMRAFYEKLGFNHYDTFTCKHTPEYGEHYAYVKWFETGEIDEKPNERSKGI